MDRNNPYIDKFNYWSSHNQIARMLSELPKGSRVLDVGTSSGTLARMCSTRGYVMRGIEPIEKWVNRDLYSEIFVGTLELTPDTFIAGHSAVVCGDVLEHLVYPEEQLKRLVNKQPKGCLFIISVPNIANIWCRMNLLLGHFDYTERGILDRTHLHFYTRRTLIDLLHNVGLIIKELNVTPIPLDLINPYFVKNAIGRRLFQVFSRLTEWWPTLLGYQWVVKSLKEK